MTMRTKSINTWAVLAMIVTMVVIVLRYVPGIIERHAIWEDVLAMLLAAAAVLLLASLIHRCRALMRRSARQRSIPRRMLTQMNFPVTADNASHVVRRVLNPEIVRGEDAEPRIMLRTYGRSGVWGSIILHAGFLLILAGLSLSHWMSERNSLAMTEGEQRSVLDVDPAHERIAAGVLSAGSADVRLMLRGFEVDRPAGETETTASHLAAEWGDERIEDIAQVNRSVDVGEWTIHHTGIWGYSPELLVIREPDSILFNAFVRLQATASAGGVFVDSVDIPGLAFPLTLTLSPDAVPGTGSDSSRSKQARNPVLNVTLHRGDGSDETIRLHPGQSALHGDVRIAFAGLRRWSRLDAVRDPGLDLLLYGCIVSVLGLFLRISLTERTIVAEVCRDGVGCHVTLFGHTEKYPCTFRHDVALLEARIRDEIQRTAAQASQTHAHSMKRVHHAAG